LKILLASFLVLLHFGIRSPSANASITNNNTPAMDIQTNLLVVRNFFPPEFDSSAEDGPSACFPGVFREGGDGGTQNGGVGVEDGGGADGGGGVDGGGDMGAGTGEVDELNGLPSFLQQATILANK
jgi:hypothetical protein